jgi:hypothetical protein
MARVPLPDDDTEMNGVIYDSTFPSDTLNRGPLTHTENGSSQSGAEDGTNFEKIFHGPTSYEGIKVTFYKSRETGLKVMVADAQIPIVHGYLTVPTEILDDTGCPHVNPICSYCSL